QMAATRVSHATSARLRDTGARQSPATFNCGSARLTQSVRDGVSTRTISDDTPPSSGWSLSGVSALTSSRRLIAAHRLSGCGDSTVSNPLILSGDCVVRLANWERDLHEPLQRSNEARRPSP